MTLLLETELFAKVPYGLSAFSSFLFIRTGNSLFGFGTLNGEE